MDTTDRITQTLVNIENAVAKPDQWPSVMRRIGAVLPIDYASVTSGTFVGGQGEPVQADIEYRFTYQDRPGVLRDYVETVGSSDPHHGAAQQQPIQFTELHTLPCWPAIQRSRYYNDFALPHRLTRTARFAMQTRDNRFVSFDVNWDRDIDRVSTTARGMMMLLGAQIGSSVRFHASTSADASSASALMRLSNMVGEAAFLVGLNGQVHDTNEVARDLLAFDRAFRIDGGKLVLESVGATERLHRRLAACGTLKGRFFLNETFAAVSSVSGTPMEARIVPLVGLEDRSSPKLAMVTVSVGQRAAGYRACLRASLTMRERHCMLALLEFHSEAKAAIALCMTLNTFRTHRKRSYAKLGVSNRAELTAVLLDGRTLQ